MMTVLTSVRECKRNAKGRIFRFFQVMLRAVKKEFPAPPEATDPPPSL